MKTLKFITAFILVAFALLKGFSQTTKVLDGIVPKEIVDARSGVTKMINGAGSFVNVNINAGIKYIDGCSDYNFGTLKIELQWFNEADEVGKFTLKMMKDLKTNEQDKISYLKHSDFNDVNATDENIANGTLRYISKTKNCVNEISGPTGKSETDTHLRCYLFNKNIVMKIDFDSKIKLQTAKNIVLKIIKDVEKLDFDSFKTWSIQEKD